MKQLIVKINLKRMLISFVRPNLPLRGLNFFVAVRIKPH